MGSEGVAGDELIGTPTDSYLNLSENTVVRQVLEFFKGYPETIVVETSRMGNPYHIIKTLAETSDIVEEEDISKKVLNRMRDRVIAGILFWAGLRDSEITFVKKKDIDFISKTFNVPTLKQRKKSGVVYRPVPLDHVPAKELKLWNRYIELRNISGEQRIIDVTPRSVERATHRVLGLNPHALRHALGLYLYELTKDIRLVSQILRHTNIANTMIYTRLSMEGIREKLSMK